MASTVISPDVNISPDRIPRVKVLDSTRYAIYPGKRVKAHGWQSEDTPARKAKVKSTSTLSKARVKLLLR